jgi:hypothetical protein
MSTELTAPTTAPTTAPRREDALALLAGGVPLSLLLDLAAAVPSSDLYRHEVADTSWLTAASAC